MNIKMIVTDLDRTLLRSDSEISEYSKHILFSCRQRGIMIVFATARAEHSCRRFIDFIKPDAIVSNGGAIVRIGDEIVYRAAMSMETTNKLLLTCMNRSNIGYITVDTDKGYFVNSRTYENDYSRAEYLPAFYVDFSKGLDCDSYKICVDISDDTTAYEIAAEFPSVEVIPFSGEDWYRFADKDADKWYGVRALAARTGTDPSYIVAFGDDYSDIDMLKECGIGVAVTNAIDEVKSATDQICDTNNNDGVAKWLEENILNQPY
jgi:hypothetical protein